MVSYQRYRPYESGTTSFKLLGPFKGVVDSLFSKKIMNLYSLKSSLRWFTGLKLGAPDPYLVSYYRYRSCELGSTYFRLVRNFKGVAPDPFSSALYSKNRLLCIVLIKVPGGVHA